MTVYVDESLRSTAQEALGDWDKAFNAKGIDLDIQFTGNQADLLKGVTMAILDGDNVTTRLDMAEGSTNLTADTDFELSRLGGLSMTTSSLTLVDADSDDKYNRDGSITRGEVLKNAKYIVQMNSEALQGSLLTNVMKHELGHLFGLGHKSDDSLMTEFVSSSVFTGEISELAIDTATSYMLSRLDSFA